jgi:NAD(P)-dependent dehydrogenase (short-subunit alcohol dehydrogenase family)
MRDLEGKVCVITGGGSGIGLAMARRFQQAGMHVAIGDIEPAALAAAVESFPGAASDVLAVRCDVTSLDDMQEFRQAVIDRFGAVHVVCLNAGVAVVGPITTTSVRTWKWLLDVNVLGVVHGIDAFAAELVEQGQGHFVLTASAAGLHSSPWLGAYSATKHAVVGIATALGDELRDVGVGVSVLCPGLVRTRIFESERNRPEGFEEIHGDQALAESLTKMIERGVEPDHIAEAVYDAVLSEKMFIVPTRDVSVTIKARLEQVRAALPPD